MRRSASSGCLDEGEHVDTFNGFNRASGDTSFRSGSMTVESHPPDQCFLLFVGDDSKHVTSSNAFPIERMNSTACVTERQYDVLEMPFSDFMQEVSSE